MLFWLIYLSYLFFVSPVILNNQTVSALNQKPIEMSQLSEKPNVTRLVVFDQLRAVDQGTGFWISNNELITAYHVVRDFDSFDLLLQWETGSMHYVPQTKCEWINIEMDVCVIQLQDNIPNPIRVQPLPEDQNYFAFGDPLNPSQRKIPVLFRGEELSRLYNDQWLLMGDIQLYVFDYKDHRLDLRGMSGGYIGDEKGNCLGMIVAERDRQLLIVSMDEISKSYIKSRPIQ